MSVINVISLITVVLLLCVLFGKIVSRGFFWQIKLRTLRIEAVEVVSDLRVRSMQCVVCQQNVSTKGCVLSSDIF